ncbi:MAG: tRNA pseudouridine(55) synthase TruB [Solirubrobacterales bacterium]
MLSKAAGITSHDLVAQVRRGLPRKTKVGHAGTLDPFATGLMLVLVGRGTRLQRYLVGLPKAYRAGVRLGVTSTTGDPTGALSDTGRRADENAVRGALERLTGEIRQRVPAYSAVKVEGVRLYQRARAGEEVELPVRTVRIERLELARFDEPAQEAELVVECSSGTYVRQLVADLGELCGAGAHCTRLERTRVGPFSLPDADPERVVPLSEALGFLPERPLSRDEAAAVRNGRPVEGAADGPVRLTFEDELIAVAVERDGALRPETVVA